VQHSGAAKGSPTRTRRAPLAVPTARCVVAVLHPVRCGAARMVLWCNMACSAVHGAVVQHGVQCRAWCCGATWCAVPRMVLWCSLPYKVRRSTAATTCCLNHLPLESSGAAHNFCGVCRSAAASLCSALASSGKGATNGLWMICTCAKAITKAGAALAASRHKGNGAVWRRG